MVKLSNIHFAIASIGRCSVAVCVAQSIFNLPFIFPNRSSTLLDSTSSLSPTQLRADDNPHAVSMNLTSLSDPCEQSHTCECLQGSFMLWHVSEFPSLKPSSIPLYEYVSDRQSFPWVAPDLLLL